MTMIIEGVTCGNCTKANGIPVKHATTQDVRNCYAGRYGVGEQLMSDAEETRLIQARERAEDERVAAEKARRDAEMDERFRQSQFYRRAQAGRYVGGNKQTPSQTQVEDPWVKVRALQRQLPDIEHMRYAIQVIDFERNGSEPVWKFYQIDKPTKGKWVGRTFVKVMASDTTYAIRKPDSLINILTAILHNPMKAATDYGKQVGECPKCHATLTDPESIARGIGPVCATRVDS